MKTAVYTAVIDPNTETFPVYPPERQAEIDRCLKDSVRLEKYTAWKLLERAVEDTFGIQIEAASFSKNPYGKWMSDKFYFSISHSGGAVAIAVSEETVGVDIEVVKRYRDGLESKILTDKEHKALETIEHGKADEYIIRKWSEKESIFKTLDQKGFEPRKIETSEYSVASTDLDILEKRFVLSVCSADLTDIKYYLNIQI